MASTASDEGEVRPGPPARVAVRWLYLRGLALVHLVAFASFAVQQEALIGPDGVQPLAPFLEAVHARLGVEAFLRLPTVLWLAPGAVQALCAFGLSCALLLLVGVPLEGPLLLLLWGSYVSVCSAGQLFLGFQWDTLLCEATFVAMFVARWDPRPSTPPRWAWWAQHWLVLRLFLLAGWVKLASGDPTWRDGTALDVHFWTQPLPNPLSPAFAHLPHALLAAGVVLTFVVELVLPFGVLLGRRGRGVTAAAFAALMLLLAISGNYGFFQLLTLVLCLPLLDDGHLPPRFVAWVGAAPRKAWHLGAPVAALHLLLTLVVVPREPLEVAQPLLHWTAPWRSANRYGLFANMTTTRDEVVLKGTWDGRAWRELPLRYKPGDPDRTPPQVAPHMPRLDWQLWFAALSTCERNRWVPALMTRVVEGSPAVLAQFAPHTFDDGPPLAVRAERWSYTLAPSGSPHVWLREPRGPYCRAEARRP